jgi:beta-lactamase regulating signal transducer with metallopeptidase domain/HEAT repeat protein
MMQSILTPVVRELGLDIFLRATVILAVAALVVYRLKKSSAAVRYVIWGAAFFTLIILPIVTYTVPEWTVFEIGSPTVTVPVYSGGAMSDGSLSSTQTYDYGKNGAAHTGEKTGGNSGHSGVLEAEKEGGGESNIGETDAVESAPTREYRAASRHTKDALGMFLVSALFTIWALVAVVLAFRFVKQLLEVGGITKRAIPVESSGLGGEIGNIIASLDIMRRVSVMLSEEVSMPFAWGFFRPVIILPIDAGEWPGERVRSVMAHELAHIARGDYLVQIFIELVRVFYWPNPIVWFAARRCVMERERACDDFALRCGTLSVDYASHLLHIARTQIERGIPVPAVTMAGEPGLKERIGYVMDRKMNRSPMRKGTMVITAFLLVFLVLPIGTMAIKANRWKIPDTRGLIRQLSEERNPTERSMAAWWLGEHETRKAVEPLLEALKDDSKTVRLTSAWALGEIKDRDSVDGLIELLETDDDLLVREMAALALGEIEDPYAVGALKKAYESDDRLALAVVWALGEIGQRGDDEAYNVREEIIDSLGERSWRNEEVWTGTLRREFTESGEVESLVKYLAEKDEDRRLEAAFSLGFLGIKQRFETISEVESAVGALISSLEDPVPEVRAMAVWALDEINPSRRKVSYFKNR